jgi:hypothetical protein
MKAVGELGYNCAFRVGANYRDLKTGGVAGNGKYQKKYGGRKRHEIGLRGQDKRKMKT